MYKVIDKDYLAHHGIEGQKWGVTNGPPYPLDSEDHSAAERRAGTSGWSKEARNKERTFKKGVIKAKTPDKEKKEVLKQPEKTMTATEALKNKSYENMSTKEINAINNRAEAINKLRDNAIKEWEATPPGKITAFLGKVGTVALDAAVKGLVQAVVNTGKTAIGIDDKKGFVNLDIFGKGKDAPEAAAIKANVASYRRQVEEGLRKQRGQ